MKILLLSVNSTSEEWYASAAQLYQKKISHLFPFELVSLKKSNASREQATKKKEQESEKIFEFLRDDDFVVLFDEKGQSFDSMLFSKKIEGIMNSGKKRCVFICGGAYGVDERLKARSNLTVNLSPFVLNHLIAQIVILEQLYRSLTIIKNIPYHNT